MKRRAKILLLFLALFFLSPLLCSSLASAEAISETLDIGVILPLSGDASYWGSNPRKGLDLALLLS